MIMRTKGYINLKVPATTRDCLNRQPIIIFRLKMHNYRSKKHIERVRSSKKTLCCPCLFHPLLKGKKLAHPSMPAGRNDELPLLPDCAADQPRYFTNQVLLQNAYGVQVGKLSN